MVGQGIRGETPLSRKLVCICTTRGFGKFVLKFVFGRLGHDPSPLDLPVSDVNIETQSSILRSLLEPAKKQLRKTVCLHCTWELKTRQTEKQDGEECSEVDR